MKRSANKPRVTSLGFKMRAATRLNGAWRNLNAEWDIERTLEANAATASLIGLAMGATVDRRWFLFPAVVAGFLLQHALQGWCPPLPVFRRMGIRISYEIDHERYALKSLRGDFAGTQGTTSGAGLSAVMAAVEK